ncbi:preprotein translocase subunit SecE [[Clostridium] polysaccharolyticum]|uniref:Protein translocase subunit SecE n=1 Tax=[Clostridium] polysaccharolyticum TaxID=29364 RepID=A0A1I0BUT5_9FIRM|nr:preprotein translocase subunit SecE [[Clostridium] polysaccharolyticum]SET10831.1 preprotein translocase subunit SecE [[Clostridium] polysaccharolyticum]
MEEKAKAKEGNAKKNSFFTGLKAEFHKVIWPSKDTVIKQSTAVVVVSIILGIVISLLDSALSLVMKNILNIG